MSWTYKYDPEEDETTIYYKNEEKGRIDGQITRWKSRMPQGDAKEIIKEAVDDPIIVDILYGFEEIAEEQSTPTRPCIAQSTETKSGSFRTENESQATDRGPGSGIAPGAVDHIHDDI